MNAARLITLNDLELQRFLLAIVLLFGAAHLFGFLFHHWKMPKVIGEIVGGLILGPSLFGYFCPEAYNWIFNASAVQPKLLSGIYWFGLVLLMFISGFEIQKSFSRSDGRLIGSILLGGTMIPFLAGWLMPTFLDVSDLIGSKQNLLGLQLVLGIALAVTSIPVISKIFIDLHLVHTRFAKIVVAAATIEDVLLWVLLGVATGVVSSAEPSMTSISIHVLVSVGFFAIGLVVIPRLLRLGGCLNINFVVKSSPSGYALFLCFFFATLASLLTVNIVFGALVGGIIVGLMPEEKFERVRTQIREVSLGFFVPLYFGIVGLKLDLIHHFAILPFLGFLLFATLFKVGGTVVAARLTKLDWLPSFNLGVAMNTRGGPGIVLATVGFELGIISEMFFVILVLVAIFTSLMAGFWFSFVLSRGWDLALAGLPGSGEHPVLVVEQASEPAKDRNGKFGDHLPHVKEKELRPEMASYLPS